MDPRAQTRATAAKSLAAQLPAVANLRNANKGDLRPHEANAVIAAAGRVGRQRLRDEVLLRLMYRHGLRASEAKPTKWTDFDLTPGSGRRPSMSGGSRAPSTVSTHWTDEVSALRKLKATSTSPFVFVSERGGGLSRDIDRAHRRAGGPGCKNSGSTSTRTMLRHATGYALANERTDTRLIQDFLGHTSIANTVRHTGLASVALRRCGCGRTNRVPNNFGTYACVVCESPEMYRRHRPGCILCTRRSVEIPWLSPETCTSLA
jgi:integrase